MAGEHGATAAVAGLTASVRGAGDYCPIAAATNGKLAWLDGTS